MIKCNICKKEIHSKTDLVTYSDNPVFLINIKSAHKDCFKKLPDYGFAKLKLSPIVTIIFGLILFAGLLYVSLSFSIPRNYKIMLLLISIVPLIYTICILKKFYGYK